MEIVIIKGKDGENKIEKAKLQIMRNRIYELIQPVETKQYSLDDKTYKIEILEHYALYNREIFVDVSELMPIEIDYIKKFLRKNFIKGYIINLTSFGEEIVLTITPL